jgi:hypothetical protein
VSQLAFWSQYIALVTFFAGVAGAGILLSSRQHASAIPARVRVGSRRARM